MQTHFFNTFIYLLAISLLLTAYSCSTKSKESSKTNNELVYERISEITASSSESDDAPLLSFAKEVAVDSKGSIFIFDSGASKIYVYDKDGKYQHEIGREGSGPGEIGQLTTIYVDSNDHLITADRENARITKYNYNGEVLSSQQSMEISSIRNIREMPDGRYLLTGWNGENLIHIADSSFKSLVASFGKISDFEKDRENMELSWLQSMAGTAFPVSDRKIGFAPNHYQGLIYTYQQVDSGTWELENIHDGYRTIEPAVIFSTSEPDYYDGIKMGTSGRIYITSKGLSFGFYQQDENLFHISYSVNEEDSVRFVLERFNKDLKLQKYYTSDNLNIGHGTRRQVEWMNNQGHLYFSDNSDVPRVDVLQINY